MKGGSLYPSAMFVFDSWFQGKEAFRGRKRKIGEVRKEGRSTRIQVVLQHVDQYVQPFASMCLSMGGDLLEGMTTAPVAGRGRGRGDC